MVKPLVRRESLPKPVCEEWRSVVGYEGYYEVSSLGRVRSVPRVITERNTGLRKRHKGRIMTLVPNRHGYLSLRLNRGGKGDTRRVHRLVAEAFIGGGEGLQACHINGIRNDNRLENLRWGTAADNQLDSVRHGTHHKTRNTHCPQGHEYDDANTFYSVHGHRRCRECVRRSTRESMRRSAAKKRRAS